MKRLALLALLGLVGLTACSNELPPKGQLLLYLMTDAPLPPPPGEALAAADPLPLFDTVRFDIIPPGASDPCPGCTREFALDRALVAGARASFGFEPEPGASGYRARVRLFRADLTNQGEPRTDGSIDAWFALPPVASEGLFQATMTLSTDSATKPGDPDHPEAVVEGPPSGNIAGTWPGARRAPCTGKPAAGEVCIRGGAYWMGSTLANLTGPPHLYADELRLVVVSPFFLDADEMTVAAFRATKLASASDPQRSSGSTAGTADADWCTFTDAGRPGDDTAPINCATWDKAREVCQARGGDLPTEAQIEFALGAFESSLYIWGTDEPSCSDAVFGRAKNGTKVGVFDDACMPPFGIGGPGPIRSGARDVLCADGPACAERVFDLAGDLSEWSLDVWNRVHEPDGYTTCWTSGVLHDPICDPGCTQHCSADDPHDLGVHPIRGGSWILPAASMRAAWRSWAGKDLRVPDIGFRCARPAKGGL